MRNFLILPALALASALALTIAPTPATAQSTAPSVEFNVLKVEGLVTGARYKVDAAYADKYARPVASPFEFIVPLGDGFINAVEDITSVGPYVKIHFATPERVPIENIQFIPMTLPLMDPAERLKLLAKLMAEQAYPQSTAGQMGNKIEVLRGIEFGPYKAVELVARYTDPTYGLSYIRMIGIPHPERAESVYAVINVIEQQRPIKTMDDFQAAQTGRALSTFRYK